MARGAGSARRERGGAGREVGAWIGEQVLGDVGRALVERAPVTVRVELPAGAEVLAYRPLELGWVGEPVMARRK